MHTECLVSVGSIAAPGGQSTPICPEPKANGKHPKKKAGAKTARKKSEPARYEVLIPRGAARKVEKFAKDYGHSPGAIVGGAFLWNGIHAMEQDEGNLLPEILKEVTKHTRMEKALAPLERSKRYSRCRLSIVDYFGHEVYAANVPRKDVEDLKVRSEAAGTTFAHVLREALHIVSGEPAPPKDFNVPPAFIAFVQIIAKRWNISASQLLTQYIDEHLIVPDNRFDAEYMNETAQEIAGGDIDAPWAPEPADYPENLSHKK